MISTYEIILVAQKLSGRFYTLEEREKCAQLIQDWRDAKRKPRNWFMAWIVYMKYLVGKKE